MREWIVTNGLGGYSFFTTRQSTTRKFHGLLIASLQPPVERWMFVQNILDSVLVKGKRYHLYEMKPVFSFDLMPTLTYDCDGCIIQKKFFMHHGYNTALIQYSVQTDTPVTIVHEPIVTSRHFYDVYQTKPPIDLFIQEDNGTLVISPSNIQHQLKIRFPGCSYKKNPYWLPIYYPTDAQRKDSCHDHLFHIGQCERYLETPTTYFVTCTIEKSSLLSADSIYRGELERKKRICDLSALPAQYEKLVLSSDSFLVRKGDHTTIIAGYPWFSDWGRDTLIALPGLCLVTKRHRLAKDILLELHRTCKHGIIPNTFNDRNGEPSYNTVDASLWFIDRIYQYLRYTDDLDLLRTIYPTMESIIDNYHHGTLHNIHMDEDYLIAHDPGLTWMDVKLGDFYPTPRGDKAVEIQALWYNALCCMSMFAIKLGRTDKYSDLAEKVQTSFRQVYDRQYDTLGTKDTSNRPNKLFLVSLSFTMIDTNVQSEIVENVKEELLTIFGPRTLSQKDNNYKGMYMGNYHRDLAYHNGIVWPWLMGPFITAFLKTQGYEEKWRTYASQEYIEPLLHIYGGHWDGSIHEIFDAEPPYMPQGCVSQAWSVAEILRAIVEDILYERPPYEEDYLLNEVRI
jgi:predicted glycogen debranching enzyme